MLPPESAKAALPKPIPIPGTDKHTVTSMTETVHTAPRDYDDAAAPQAWLPPSPPPPASGSFQPLEKDRWWYYKHHPGKRAPNDCAIESGCDDETESGAVSSHVDTTAENLLSDLKGPDTAHSSQEQQSDDINAAQNLGFALIQDPPSERPTRRRFSQRSRSSSMGVEGHLQQRGRRDTGPPERISPRNPSRNTTVIQRGGFGSGSSTPTPHRFVIPPFRPRPGESTQPDSEWMGTSDASF